jgi:hypothetical protein
MRFLSEDHQAVQALADQIPGWLMAEDIFNLYKFASSNGRVILEIGTFQGKSTTVLLRGALSNPSQGRPTLYSIDINPRCSFLGRKTLARQGLDAYAIFFTGTLQTITAQYRLLAPTLIFVDGDHTYDGVRKDTETLSGLACCGTPILFHDYKNPDTPGITSAVDEWIGDGYAEMIEHIGCHAVVHTTARCTGVAPERDPERQRPLQSQRWCDDQASKGYRGVYWSLRHALVSAKQRLFNP